MTSYVDVPGAELYHEISGSGPVLLMIPGGTDDARDFAGVVPLLAEHHTVVRYDCRGLSRSRLDDPGTDIPIETHRDDALRMLRAVGGEPAYVFGTSSGAQVGLALAARHPDLVRGLIAHEPPAVGLLPADDPRRGLLRRVHHDYLRHGIPTAMATFLDGTGMRTTKHPERNVPESAEAAGQMRERLVWIERNLDFFLARMIGPAADYLPDIPRLRRISRRIAVAVGDASVGQLAHDTGCALAELLGLPPMSFPGGHTGFVSHPVGFADKLRSACHTL